MIEFKESNLSVSALVELLEQSSSSKEKLNTLYLFLKTLYPSIYCGLQEQSRETQILSHWSETDIEILEELNLRSRYFLEQKEPLLLDFDTDRHMLFIPGPGINQKVRAVFLQTLKR